MHAPDLDSINVQNGIVVVRAANCKVGTSAFETTTISKARMALDIFQPAEGYNMLTASSKISCQLRSAGALLVDRTSELANGRWFWGLSIAFGNIHKSLVQSYINGNTGDTSPRPVLANLQHATQNIPKTK